MINNTATRLVAIVLIAGGLFALSRIIDSIDRESVAATATAAPDTATPHFTSRWRPGRLQLTGHTASADHERTLHDIARQLFPEAQVLTDFEPLESVPVFWADGTVQILYLLAETDSADAALDESSLSITSVTTKSEAFDDRLEILRQTLPDALAVHVDAVVVDDSLSSETACARAFATFQPGQINFEESTATFRNSAFPRLDRIVALARNCRDSTIEIVGHTDSSGDPAFNLQLSVSRAQAVGDYLAEAGINVERLEIRGIGASEPIATNKSRYGRSKNRRIEVNFTTARE